MHKADDVISTALNLELIPMNKTDIDLYPH